MSASATIGPAPPQPKETDAAPLKPDFSQASLGAYRQQDAAQPEISQEAWNEAKKHAARRDNFWGRAGTRFVSGGVGGSLAYVVADMYVGHKLHGYRPTEKAANWVQHMAKAIDFGVFKPIEKTVSALGGDGVAAVHFRPTKFVTEYKTGAVAGRTGAVESINVAAGFAAYSWVDAALRDIGDLTDRNAKKSWLDDKGNIDPGEAAKSVGKALWRYTTYNAGEDAAVTLPYIYLLKGVRKGVDKFSPGFAQDFDRSYMGASFTVDENNKVNGNKTAAGLAYFQLAFTGYNWLTVLYRETYNYMAAKIAGKPATLVGAPDAEEEARQRNKSLLGKVNDVIKWMFRGAGKATIYMAGTIPFYSWIRTVQQREKGLFVNPKGEMLTHETLDPKNPSRIPKRDVVHAIELVRVVNSDDKLYYAPVSEQVGRYGGSYEVDRNLLANANQEFNVFKSGGKISGRLAEWNSAGGKLLRRPAQLADNYLPGRSIIKENLGLRKNESFASRVAPRVFDAFAGYLPYKIAKTEFSKKFDTAKMDMAMEGLYDSVVTGNISGITRGVGEIGRTIVGKELADPAREKEAQRRIALDQSPADVFTATDAEIEEEKRQSARKWQTQLEEKKRHAGLSVKDRLVTGKPTTDTATDVSIEHPGVNPMIKDIVNQGKSSNRLPDRYAKHTDREDMLALKDLHPLSNSIN